MAASRSRVLLIPVFALAIPMTVEAQVDESLVTRRWKTDTFWAETYDKPLLTSKGVLEETGESIRFFHWDSEGRIKFDRKELNPPAWIGYRAKTITISSEADLLDHTFSDVALAVAVDLGSLGENWSFTASAGIGTANDGRWDNRDALFPVATLEFTHNRRGASPSWHLGLSLDGNRPLFQSVPLPYAMIEAKIDDKLDLLLGFPKTEVVLRPFAPMIFTVQWAFPSQASARLEADLGAGFSVFGEAARRIDAFHLRHEERTRIFYTQNTAELGFRWAGSWIDVSLSVGYAFGQRFFTGDDLRDRTRVTSVEDLPFIALTFPSTFWAAPLSSDVYR
jgi:hypothetical protein